jgi:7 transmembrane helices usually fused to an inactive transglutaminase
MPVVKVDLNNTEARNPAGQNWLFAVLLLLPMLVMAGKYPVFPTSAAFTSWFSLADLPKHVQTHAEYMLFVPLSAVIVAFFRLTLGIPVLSLFRPILVAIAFRMMGVPTGLLFLALVLGTIVVMRPLLKGRHYYARVPVLLSIVAGFMVVPLMLERYSHDLSWQHLAYFPLISLALICEAFTKTLDEKGLAEAAWPTLNTVLVGMVINWIATFHGVLHLLLRFPELLMLQIGVVFLIEKYLHLELLDCRNPFLIKRAQLIDESRQLAAASLSLVGQKTPNPEIGEQVA